MFGNEDEKTAVAKLEPALRPLHPERDADGAFDLRALAALVCRVERVRLNESAGRSGGSK